MLCYLLGFLRDVLIPFMPHKVGDDHLESFRHDRQVIQRLAKGAGTVEVGVFGIRLGEAPHDIEEVAGIQAKDGPGVGSEVRSQIGDRDGPGRPTLASSYSKSMESPS